MDWRIDSELLPLQWSQIDLAEGTIRIPPGGSKNRDGRVVCLTPELKAGLAIQRSRVLAMERELGRVIPQVSPQNYGHRGGHMGFAFGWGALRGNPDALTGAGLCSGLVCWLYSDGILDSFHAKLASIRGSDFR